MVTAVGLNLNIGKQKFEVGTGARAGAKVNAKTTIIELKRESLIRKNS